jgi:hypothetical protein
MIYLLFGLVSAMLGVFFAFYLISREKFIQKNNKING